MGVIILAIVSRLVWKKVDLHNYHEQKLDKTETDKLVVSYKISKITFIKRYNLFYDMIFKAKNESEVMSLFTKLLNIIFLPVLFSLIGNEVDFDKIEINLIGKLNSEIYCCFVWIQFFKI